MRPYASLGRLFDASDLDCAGLRENARPTGAGKPQGPGGDRRAMNSQRRHGRARVRTRLNKAARLALKREIADLVSE